VATSDIWRFNEQYKTGALSVEDFVTIEAHACRSRGACAVMGTASTMACMVESLGVSLPDNAAIPAADARRKVLAQLSGRRCVEIVRENLNLSRILTRQAFENAIRVNAALGGSTNFAIHLLAIAGRLGVSLSLDDMDVLSQGIPLLVNLQPSGDFFMEDFFYAGGLPVVIRELSNLLHGNCLTVNGKTLEENSRNADCYDQNVIAPFKQPFREQSGLMVLKGNLAPEGAILKPSAASPHLMQHRGRAVVFENIEDYIARVDDPELPVDENSVLVLKNSGLKGYPGMPEIGNIQLPKKLLTRGIRDVVRISDARMSGTAFGTIVLHVSPEAAAGGTLALVENGDFIELDVARRRLHLDIEEEVLARRRKYWKAPDLGHYRGYIRIFLNHVEQPHLGADLDILKGGSGTHVRREHETDLMNESLNELKPVLEDKPIE
jgi:dihydroxy-acid dehydratase